MWLKKIQNVPIGYCEVRYNNKKYAVTRKDFNNGKSIKIYAKELAGRDFVSFNYYITSDKESLKPCEMEEGKVINFLNNFTII